MSLLSPILTSKVFSIGPDTLDLPQCLCHIYTLSPTHKVSFKFSGAPTAAETLLQAHVYLFCSPHSFLALRHASMFIFLNPQHCVSLQLLDMPEYTHIPTTPMLTPLY